MVAAVRSGVPPAMTNTGIGSGCGSARFAAKRMVREARGREPGLSVNAACKRIGAEGKVARVEQLRRAGHRVLAVGDGVNDAPVLAAADTGVAMAAGAADLTRSTADAVVVRDELLALPAVVALSRRARRVVVANLVVAGCVIAVLVGWDLLGHLPLPLGVAGHEGSTVIVGLNGLRLLRRRAWPQPRDGSRPRGPGEAGHTARGVRHP